MRRQQWKRRGWKNLKAGRTLEKPRLRMTRLEQWMMEARAALESLGKVFYESFKYFERMIKKWTEAFDDIYSSSPTG